MSYEFFRPEDVIVLLAAGWFIGLVVAANLSVRSKREETPDSRDHAVAGYGSQNRETGTRPASSEPATIFPMARPVAETSALKVRQQMKQTPRKGELHGLETR